MIKNQFFTKALLVSILFTILTLFGLAQNSTKQDAKVQEKCKTHIIHNQLLNSDPEFKNRILNNESIIQNAIKSGNSSRAIYTIPVVVHVIHKNEAIGTGTNISDAQIVSAIASLNQAFRKQASTIYFGNGVDTEIEFCLAVRDPNNQPHSGINRVNGSGTSDYATNGITNDAGSSMNETTIKALSKWSNTLYYNIWIVSEIDNNNGGAGTQGYAYFPGAGPTVDGAVILYNAFGTTGNLKSYTNKNMTAIHELGHGLNLYHTFEGGSCTESNCSTQGDRCCDTPPHPGGNTTCGTPECSGTQPVKNYMDYTGEDCTNMFTNDQKTRMRAALSGTRAGLLTSSGCSPVFALDAGITQIFKPAATACGSSIIPQVELKNFGSTTLTSATITYVINGVSNTYNWTGSLGASVTTTVNLPSINLNAGSNTFSATTSAPNGGADQNTSNDGKSVTSTVTVGNGVTLSITLDNFGTETTWNLKNSIGTTVASGGPYTNGAGGSVITQNFCLADDCFDFTILDSFSDGICCANGNGSYQLVDDKTTTVLASGGTFGASETKNFCVPLAAPTSNFTASSTGVCSGNSITFTDISTMSPTSWSWTFAGGVPSTSTSQNPTIAYSTPGTYTVTLTATNGIGAGNTETKTDYITILNPATGACAANTTNLANSFGMGIYNVTLNTINKTTGGSVADGGYKDFTCTNITTLIPGTSYPVSVKVGNANAENVKIYIDYNNNGVLTDAGELVYSSTAAATETHSGTINTPAVVSKNNLLRMRVITDFSAISGPCYSPTYGQVEDYGVVFYGVATPPVANFTPSATTICAGGSITFTDISTNSPSAWSWTINGGSPSTSSSQNPTATFATAGNYNIILTATNIDGSDSKTIPIVVNAAPSAPSASSNGPVCVGQTLTVDATTISSATYNWTGPNSFTSSNQNPTVSTSATTAMAGTYSVTATVGGCTSAAGTIVVVVNANDAATISYSGSPYCTGGSNPTPTITGTTGGTFSSTAGLTINSSTGLITLASSTAGNYTIIYTTGGSCSTTATYNVVINNGPSAPTASSNGPVCVGQTLTLSATLVSGATYSWTGPNSFSSTNQNPTVNTSATTAMAGTYTVTASASGCSSAPASVVVVVNTNDAATISYTGSPFCASATNPSATITGTTGGVFSSTAGLSINSSSGLITLSTSTAGNYTVTYTTGGSCSATAIANIVINSVPNLSAPTIVDANCGGSNGSISTSGSSGTSPYTYSINGTTFQGTGTFSNISANNYTVTIKDANNCTNTINAVVNDLSNLTATISSQTNINCFGANTGSATIQGNGTSGYTYSIDGTNFVGSGVFANLAAGSYTLTVKDLNNCTATQPVTITQPSQLNISGTTTNASCGNSDGTITATGSGGTGALTYSVDGTNFQASTSFTGIAAGGYTLTIKDASGCTKTTTVSVASTGGLTASISSQINIACNGGSNGSVTVQGNGSSGYSYSFNGGAFTGTSTFTNLSAGSYYVDVKDVANCVASQTVNITEPSAISISATTTNSTCGNPNGSITVSASGGTGSLTYSINGTNFQSSNVFSGVLAMTYTITVKDANLCSKTFTVTVNDQNGLIATISSQANPNCFGSTNGSATIQGSGTSGYTYSINGGTYQASGTFNNLSAGTYTLTVKDVNNCTASQPVTLSQPGQLTISATTSDATCGSTNGTITAVGGNGIGTLTYSIDGTNFQSSGSFTNLAGGVYTVTVKDANGCSNTALATVNSTGGLTASISSQTNVSCFGGNNGSVIIQGNGTSGYTFSKDGGAYQGSGTFISLIAGSYSFTVKDVNGCIASQAVTITQPNQITITASSTNTTCGSTNGTISASATGGTGTLTYSVNGTTFQSSGNFTNLSAGSYTVTVKDGTNCTNTKSVTVIDLSGLSASITSQTNVSCYGQNTGSVTVAGSGTSGYNYSLDGGTYQANGTFSNLAGGSYVVTVKDLNNCTVSQSVNISAPSQLTVSATTTGSTCGSSNGSISATGNGGTGLFSFSINGVTFQGSGTFPNLNGGNYTVTIKDGNSCSSTTTANVVDLSGLSLSITSQTNVTCNGLVDGSVSVQASGTGGYTYSIDGTTYQASGTFNNLAAGNYTVRVLDQNSCILTQSVIITQPNALAITATVVGSSCGNNNGSISATGTGGTAPITYSIDGVTFQTNGTFANLAPGTYTITIKDANNCTTTSDKTVSNLGNISAIITSQVEVSCFGGNNGNFIVEASGTGGYQYSIDGTTFQGGGFFTTLTAGNYTITAKDQYGCITTITTTITQPTAISTPTAITTDASCGNSDGTIDISSTGGTGAFTYSLNGSAFQANSLFTGLLPGTYSISVKDNNGCTKNSSATVYDASGLSLSVVSQTNVTCNANADGTIDLLGSGSSGYTYSIDGTNYQSSGSFTSLAAGVYTALVKDVNDCPVSQFITITEPSALTINILTVTNATCGDPNGSLSAEAYGGVSPYSYSLDNVNYTSSNNFSGLNAGTYDFYAQDNNGCSANIQITVTDLSGLSMVINSVYDVKCFGGNTGSFVAQGSGTSGYLYSVDGINYTPNGSFVYLTAGGYTVDVIDVNGCMYTQSTTINEPSELLLSVDNYAKSNCNNSNGSIEISASGGSSAYQYAINGGASQSSGIFNNYAAGTYLLSVQDNNACLTTTNFVLENAADITLFLSGGQNICTGQSTNLTAQASGGTGPYQYLWSESSTVQSITVSPNSTTSYSVEVTNPEGCVANASATVNVTPNPVTVVSGPQTACSGQTVTLTASGGSSYYWLNGSTTASINVNPITTTTYGVVAIENGCSGNTATTTITVTASPNAVASSNVTTTYLGSGGLVEFSNLSENATSIVWNFGDGSATSTDKDPIHKYTIAGVFTATLTASNGNCTDVDTILITVNAGVGISANTLLNSLSISPNPTKGLVNLELNSSLDQLNIGIYNGIGDKVSEVNSIDFVNKKYTIDLSTHAGGVYYVRINYGDETAVKKLVLIK